jgi:uncharacterized DUF497 family protein
VSLTFEWDETKARLNLEGHGVSFEEAATIFEDAFALELFDEAHSEGEDRWIAIGFSSAGRLLVVVYTEPEPGRVRIISSRRATRREENAYGE